MWSYQKLSKYGGCEVLLMFKVCFWVFPAQTPAELNREVQDLEKNVLMKLRRKVVKNPHDVPFESLGLKRYPILPT